VKTFFCFFVIFFNLFFLQAQRMHVGIAGGLSNYSGDLLDKFYHRKLTNGFIGATVHYEITSQFLLRGAFTFARVNGDDQFSEKANLQMRNLRFESAITEFSVVGEYYLFNIDEKRFSPYAFAGLAVFHFNPYTNNSASKKVFLHPLNTEGQGLYPEKKSYSLTQPAIPFGGGFKFALTENIRVGIEFGMRKLFTDYLDDVSTSYPDYNDLLTARGQTAVDLSYRGDEITGGNQSFPNKGTQRGSSQQKDIYYFTGLNISYRIGNGGGGYHVSGKKSKYGCPSVPQ
jgi:opacity protein-like surface antigen